MQLRPDTLLSDNKPLPLAGIKPSRLMKKKEWDEVRYAAYAANGYHCWACGVPISKERGAQMWQCHELYDVDWTNGVAEIAEYTGLCWKCHQFIHIDQLVGPYMRRKFKQSTVRDIVRHGWAVLRVNGIPLKREWKQWEQVAWEEWYLLWRGKKYYSDYKSLDEWKETK